MALKAKLTPEQKLETIIKTLRTPHFNLNNKEKRILIESKKKALNSIKLSNDRFRSVSHLKHPNLNNIDLSDMDLNDVNFAHFTYANLSGANFSIANLSDVNLSIANLSGANLSGANFNGADLFRAKLNHANLSGANLFNVKLNRANLNSAQLAHASLFKAKLNHANLSNTQLNCSDLFHADFSNAILFKSLFCKCNKLNNAIFDETLFSEQNITFELLNNTTITNVTFDKCLLSKECNFQRIDINAMQGNKIDHSEDWSEQNIDKYLNHINNPESGSLLTLIDSIPSRFDTEKVALATQLVDSLRQQNADVSSVTHLLFSVLYKPPYSQNQTIAEWLNSLVPEYLNSLNNEQTHDMPMFNALNQFFKYAPQNMLEHNTAFIQLIHQGIQQGGEQREKAQALYKDYLQLEQVKPYAHILDHQLGQYHDQQPDWKDKDAANLILFSPRENGPVMLLSQNTLNGMLNSTLEKSVWNHFYLYQGLNFINKIQHNTLFKKDFPLFLSAWNSQNQAIMFDKLLSVIPLDEMKDQFEYATTVKALDKEQKLIDFNSQAKLAAIFNPLLDIDQQNNRCTLTNTHLKAIFDAYELTNENRTTQAQTLFSLSAVFTKYSSSYYFGTENESPEILRRYASALMTKAYELDATQFDYIDRNNNQKKNAYDVWTNQLLGLNEAFTCTAVLSSVMIQHANDHFRSVLTQVLPPAWQ